MMLMEDHVLGWLPRRGHGAKEVVSDKNDRWPESARPAERRGYGRGCVGLWRIGGKGVRNAGGQ